MEQCRDSTQGEIQELTMNCGWADGGITSGFTVVDFFPMPCSMWDLSAPTRDRPHTPCIGVWSLNHWSAREVPGFIVIIKLFCLFQIFNKYYYVFSFYFFL